MGRKKIVKFEDGTVRRYEVFDDEPSMFQIIWFCIRALFLFVFLKVGADVWHKSLYGQAIFCFFLAFLIIYLSFRKPLNALFKELFYLLGELWDFLSYQYKKLARYIRQRKNR